MSEAIVFHHPLPVDRSPVAGSQLRPAQMIEAFASLGFEVEVVAGYSRERAQAARRVRRDIAKGRRFAFAYAESSNTPNALNDVHHLPRRPRVDARFLQSLRRAQIPTGLFYRDVYWRFDLYRQQVPIHKRLPAVAFYRADWRAYRASVDHLFLPSVRMASALPTAWPADCLSPLPPGCAPAARKEHRTVTGGLRVLYVGAVAPPLYDVRPLLDAARGLPGVHVTICCRREERSAMAVYGDLGPDVSVVHASGAELVRLYDQADVASLVLAAHPYREFAMPVKLFEAIGFGVPVIAIKGTSAGDFVAASGAGVAVAQSVVRPVLARLRAEPHQVAVLAAATERAQDENTWARRAEVVREALGRVDRRRAVA